MALGRISIKSGKKGKALPHSQYVNAQDKYTAKQVELSYSQSGNMPTWAKNDPKTFWEMSDLYERKNGSVYREHILSLPREFNQEQNLALINEWIEKQLGDKHAYTFAIHEPTAQDGEKQPHCHLMFSERTIDGIERTPEQFFKRYNSKDPTKGGAKKANTGLKHAERLEIIQQIRHDWGEHLNKHLQLNGFTPNVDMRNWKERGLSEPPKNKSMYQVNLEKKLNQHIKQNTIENTPQLSQKFLEIIQQEQTKPPQTRQGVPTPNIEDINEIYSPNDNGYRNSRNYEYNVVPYVDYDADISHTHSTYAGYEKTAHALTEEISNIKEVLKGDTQAMQQSFEQYVQRNWEVAEQRVRVQIQPQVQVQCLVGVEGEVLKPKI